MTTERETSVRFSVVVPVFNEEGNLLSLYERIQAVLEAEMSPEFELILVDDGSSDKSWSVVESLRSRDARVKGVKFTRNFGQHAAMEAGLDRAMGDFVVFMDADLQEPPEILPSFFNKLQDEGLEMVIGLRERHEEGLIRGWFSDGYARVFAYMAREEVPPNATNLRIITRKVADSLRSVPFKGSFLGGLMAWTGYSVGYVTVKMEKRFSGTTKYSLRKLIKHAANGILSYSVFPLRLATYLGFFFALMSFLMGSVMITRKLFRPDTLLGYTSLFVSTVFLGGVILFSIGLVGEYVGRVFEVVKGKPEYVVDKDFK